MLEAICSRAAAPSLRSASGAPVRFRAIGRGEILSSVAVQLEAAAGGENHRAIAVTGDVGELLTEPKRGLDAAAHCPCGRDQSEVCSQHIYMCISTRGMPPQPVRNSCACALPCPDASEFTSLGRLDPFPRRRLSPTKTHSRSVLSRGDQDRAPVPPFRPRGASKSA